MFEFAIEFEFEFDLDFPELDFELDFKSSNYFKSLLNKFWKPNER